LIAYQLTSESTLCYKS